ncbi:MAG: hopanoid-associated sugar epimerase [Vulcanimicrobiaceae bacterium]
MSGRLAFLTGGTGFVGANLARALLAAGWRVRALVRPASDLRNLEGLALETVVGALDDPALADAMAGADALFHCAAHYSLLRRDRAQLMASNVAGTRAILAAARRAGIPRTVYTSSVAAIGVRHDRPADERFQSPPDALIGAYKRSKYLAEQEASAAARAGQDVVIVNPSTPLGPWDRKPTPTGELLVRFLRGQIPPAVPATGLNVVDVADVAQGHLLAFERGRSGERYILGGENLRLAELLRRLGAQSGRPAPRWELPLAVPLLAAYLDEGLLGHLGRKPEIAIDAVRMSGETMFYDASKAGHELGFCAGPIEAALARAVSWFREHGFLLRKRERYARWQ